MIGDSEAEAGCGAEYEGQGRGVQDYRETLAGLCQIQEQRECEGRGGGGGNRKWHGGSFSGIASVSGQSEGTLIWHLSEAPLCLSRSCLRSCHAYDRSVISMDTFQSICSFFTRHSLQHSLLIPHPQSRGHAVLGVLLSGISIELDSIATGKSVHIGSVVLIFIDQGSQPNRIISNRIISKLRCIARLQYEYILNSLFSLGI